MKQRTYYENLSRWLVFIGVPAAGVFGGLVYLVATGTGESLLALSQLILLGLAAMLCIGGAAVLLARKLRRRRVSLPRAAVIDASRERKQPRD